MESEATRLKNQLVLITGGSRGIGFAIGQAMAEAGAAVALVSRDKSSLDRASGSIDRSCGFPFDVSNFTKICSLVDSIEEYFEAEVSTVVHAAGIQARHPAESFDIDEWRRILEVNLVAPFALSQEIGRRQLQEGRGGQHIFIGSLTSFISIPNISAYTASKSGIYGVVRSLSTEWSHAGIRVNGIAPGYIRTELTEAVFTDPERQRINLSRIPMGRFGEPSDVASVATFLASDQSRYISGQMIAVDGGWLSA